jgi:hypothetical protein
MATTALLLACPVLVAAQVQLRFGDPARATYSELHEGLRAGTPMADSVRRITAETKPAVLWKHVRLALQDKAPWPEAFMAITRLAELRSPAYADSAKRLSARITQGKVTAPPGRDATDLVEALRAVALEQERAKVGDDAMRRSLLAKVDTGEYGLADAWELGRLGPCTTEALGKRFLASQGEADRVRWLTLLSFSSDPAGIALLSRVYAAPDSFQVPLKFAGRASDGLLWIGTRESLAALKAARETARSRRVFDDPSLSRGGYDFLANDSSLVISRTGKWVDDWIAELPAAR